MWIIVLPINLARADRWQNVLWDAALHFSLRTTSYIYWNCGQPASTHRLLVSDKQWKRDNRAKNGHPSPAAPERRTKRHPVESRNIPPLEPSTRFLWLSVLLKENWTKCGWNSLLSGSTWVWFYFVFYVVKCPLLISTYFSAQRSDLTCSPPSAAQEGTHGSCEVVLTNGIDERITNRADQGMWSHIPFIRLYGYHYFPNDDHDDDMMTMMMMTTTTTMMVWLWWSRRFTTCIARVYPSYHLLCTTREAIDIYDILKRTNDSLDKQDAETPKRHAPKAPALSCAPLPLGKWAEIVTRNNEKVLEKQYGNNAPMIRNNSRDLLSLFPFSPLGDEIGFAFRCCVLVFFSWARSGALWFSRPGSGASKTTGASTVNTQVGSQAFTRLVTLQYFIQTSRITDYIIHWHTF